MTQDKKLIAKNELEALNNALVNLGLKRYEIYHHPDNGKNLYFLRDDTGISITGYWNYEKLNHYIMGYGKAYNRFKNN